VIAKSIWYTEHAKARVRERGISRRDVRYLIARGNRLAVSSDSAEQLWRSRAYLGRREASVVFVENAVRYLIITVQWSDEG
jgi:hypothetical protein